MTVRMFEIWLPPRLPGVEWRANDKTLVISGYGVFLRG
jgi:hypothetical protein